MRDLSWATEKFTAFHTDPSNDPANNEGRHQHTWKVRVFWASEPFRDLRSIRASLRRILDTLEGSDLPAELWSSEKIARMILQCHGNADVCGVKVKRKGIGGCSVGETR